VVRVSCAIVILAACGGGGAPQIHGLTDSTATVGQELMLMIDGSDPDGDQLTYGVQTDISLQDTATLTQTPRGAGVFRWTPLAEHIGVHPFDFTASDGENTTTESISIDVQSANGAAPIFRQPLGTGTVVNLKMTPCVDLDIVIEDADTPMVTIAEEAPLITGAKLTIVDGQNATWHWCPTHAQVQAADRYTLSLSADDAANPKTLKNYVIVLGGGGPAEHIVINEIDYDMVGTDNAEYVELFNPTTGSISLSGLQLVLVNGATNTVYQTIDLSSAATLGAGKYLVVAGAMVTVPTSAKKLDPVWSLDQIQNGAPDGVALVDGVTHQVLDALSYEGSITMATVTGFPAPVSLVEGTAVPTNVSDSNSTQGTLCRNPNGQDSDDAAADWAFCATRTPGTANVP
jgi:hypothetical protein